MPQSKKVKDYQNGYCVLPQSYWDEYEDNAFVDYFTTNLEEAEYIRSSLERADKIKYIIVEI